MKIGCIRAAALLMAIVMAIGLLPTLPVTAEAEEVNRVLQSNPVSEQRFLFTTAGWDGWLTAGEQYTVSFRVKGQGHYRVTLSDWGNGPDGCTVEETLNSDEWVSRSTAFTAGTNWSAMTVYRHPDEGGVLYFDDITFTASDGTEYVANGSFENGSSDWHGLNGTDFAVAEEIIEVKKPNHVLKLAPVSSQQYVYYDAWSQLDDGGEYTLSFRIKGRGTVRVGVNNWGNGPVTEACTVDSEDWVTVEKTYTANRYFDNGWAALMIYRDADGALGEGTVYIDDITVRNAAGEAVGGKAVFTFESGLEGWRTGDWQGTYISVVEETVMISTGSGATEPTPEPTEPPTEATDPTTEPTEPTEPAGPADPGNLVLEITTGQPSGSGAHIATGLDIVAGETYTLSLRAKGSGSATVTVVNGEWSRFKAVTTEKSNEWVEYEVTFESGSYSGWGGFIVYDESGETGRVVYVDDLVLKDSAGNVVKANDFQDTSDQGMGSGWWASNGIVKEVIAETEIDFTYDPSQEPTAPSDTGNDVLMLEINSGSAPGTLVAGGTGIDANTDYVLKFRAQGNATVVATVVDGGWNRLCPTDTVGSDGWIEYSIPFNTGSSSGWAGIIFYCENSEGGVVCIDDVVFEKADGAAVASNDFESGVNGWWKDKDVTMTVIPETDIDFTYPRETVPVEDAYTVNWAENGITVDGVFGGDEWSDADPLHLTGMTGRESLHYGTLYFKYDGNYMYMAAVVNDTTPMRNDGTGDNIWWGDSVELFYGTDLSARDEMSDRDIQVLIGGSEVWGQQNTFNYGTGKAYQAFKDMDVGLRADGDGNAIGYVIEAVIPLELLRLDDAPWTGEQILFNANIKNGDAGQVGWSNREEAGKKDPRTWKPVTFAPHAAPVDDVTVTAAAEQQLVRVSGQAEQAVGQDLNILVWDSGGNIVYVNQFATNADGSYAHDFILSAAGTYTVTVGGGTVEKPVSTTITV